MWSGYAFGGATANVKAALENQDAVVPFERLTDEREFYASYQWALNVFPRVGELIRFVSVEIGRLERVPADWRRSEVMTNIYLLCCAISDTVDDWLLGDLYDFSKAIGVFAALKTALKPVEKTLAWRSEIRAWRVKWLFDWREKWELALQDYLRFVAAGECSDWQAVSASAAALLPLLENHFPSGLLGQRCRVPAAFRSQDLAHIDVLSLGAKFAAEVDDRDRPVLVLGCRTAGSYLAPLLRACLTNAGYRSTDSITLRPKKAASLRERSKLSQIAAKSGIVAIIDEPIYSGETLIRTVGLLRKAGVPITNVVALLPIHPSWRNWKTGLDATALSALKIITLEPEEWHKVRSLSLDSVGRTLRSYLARDGRTLEHISEDDRQNASLRELSELKFHNRMKRVYTVRLREQGGTEETRHIMAKSVGWGWFSYHGFLAGDRLEDRVPPLLGLRDGILYTEWLPQSATNRANGREDDIFPAAAEYVAARTRFLGLTDDFAPGMVHDGPSKPLEELAGVLSGAYGWKGAAVLKRPRLLQKLQRSGCPIPTLIDGKMGPPEWIRNGSSFRKTDFEHHGLGKTELNATDPAYDLAEMVLHWEPSKAQEREMLGRYSELSGDAGVEARLFLYKLLAGNWRQSRAYDNLQDPRLSHRHQDFSRQYLNAFDFLTEQTTRYCAGLCVRPKTLAWNAPAVFLDIDGVLDKQIFGFPSTTAAGILAMSLLNAHGFTTALNTARSLRQVKRYCEEYGCAGGIAEYGSVVWDAISSQECVLVSSESLDEMESVKAALRRIPGVFLNEDYRYSIRAFVFDHGRTVPLLTPVIRNLLAGLHVDRLALHQTYMDTTITAKEADKGQGLLALLSLIGKPEMECVGIGDTEPDLAMFRVAARSFAPAHIPCRRTAEVLRCRVASKAYQPGLLEIARSIVHADGSRCESCRDAEQFLKDRKGLFLDLLKLADKPRWSLLMRALLDPMSVQTFRSNTSAWHQR